MSHCSQGFNGGISEGLLGVLDVLGVLVVDVRDEGVLRGFETANLLVEGLGFLWDTVFFISLRVVQTQQATRRVRIPFIIVLGVFKRKILAGHP